MIADTRLIDCQDVGTKVVEFQAHNDCVSCCHFCYNDSVIVTASHDCTIALWVSCTCLAQYSAQVIIIAIVLVQDASDGRRLKEFSGHNDRVTGCVADEKHHRYSASLSFLNTDMLVLTSTHHMFTRLLTVSWDKSVALWDMNSSETNMTVRTQNPQSLSLSNVWISLQDNHYTVIRPSLFMYAMFHVLYLQRIIHNTL